MGSKKDRKEFGQNPFSALKGFSASAPAKPETKAPPPVKAPPPPPAEETDFDAAMDWLGVQPLADREPELNPPEPLAPETEPLRPPPARDDADEFRRAVGMLQPLFREELPEELPPQATPRLTRLVRRGELHPEATLDLHGVTRDQVRDRLRWFFEDGLYHSRRLLLVITGRGRSSGADPVLRGEVERYLRHEASAWVAEWDRAPGRYGGEGALLVLLKGGRKGR